MVFDGANGLSLDDREDDADDEISTAAWNIEDHMSQREFAQWCTTWSKTFAMWANNAMLRAIAAKE